MNNKIGFISSIVHLLAALSFSLCLIFQTSYGNYFSGIILALSFVCLIGTLADHNTADAKSSAAAIAKMFASIYAVIILLVYYANITTVQNDTLNQHTYQLLSTQKFSLFFNYDLLGYAVMSLAVFFTGLTIDSQSKSDKLLKKMLLIHGVFVIAFFIPILGIFKQDLKQANLIGPLMQSCWCFYFSVIDILALRYFRKKLAS